MMGGVPVLNYNLLETRSKGKAADWVIAMKEGTTDAQLDELCASANCAMSGHPNKGGMAFIEISATDDELEATLLKAQKIAKFAEPDLLMDPIPQFDSVSSTIWNLEKVGTNSRPNEGAGVHIYVVDTGIRVTHSDFSGRVVPVMDMTSGSKVLCNGDLACAPDLQGHGTHCAGTAAGVKHGVAPAANLYTMRVFELGESPFSWTFASLDEIATSGERPAVASMSLGGQVVLEAMKEAVDAASAAGVVMVVAGGNSNMDACGFSPAYVPAAITVGSTTQSNTRSSFSNFGSCTDLWAPGSNIVSASHTSDTGATFKSGTSMACPHVSGGAALLLSTNPLLTPFEVSEQLVDSAADDRIISGLQSGDVNKMLWVGTDAPPVAEPAACPDYGYGPDSDMDCRCKRGRCYENGAYGCTWSGGSRSSVYFSFSCTGCKCYR